MSPFWILMALRMVEVVATTAATRCAKLQLNEEKKSNGHK